MKATTTKLTLINLCLVRWLRAGLLFALLLLALRPAPAATMRWTGGHASSSDWSRGANWDSGTAPVDGDILVFPAGAARLANNNDLTGLQVAAIRFIGAGGGYSLSGNGVVVTDGINANQTAGNNIIALARVTLANPLSFTVAQAGLSLTIESEVRLNGNDLIAKPAGLLILSGAISGRGTITKENPGTLSLSGNDPNTFDGDLFIRAGTVELNKGTFGGVAAVAGRLIIGDGQGGTQAVVARHRKNNQINTVTVNGSGLWDLGVFEDEVSDLDLTGDGAVTTAATGLLRLGIGADVLVNPGTEEPSISGNLELLFGNHRFTVDDGNAAVGDSKLAINAVISGLGGIVKDGSDALSLRGANTFLGVVTIEQGELMAYNTLALGSPAVGTRISNVGSFNNGVLRFLASGTVDESLTLDSSGLSAVFNPIALLVAGDVDWTGNLSLLRNAAISVGSAGSLNLSGVISGVGGLSKYGSGLLTLSGNAPNTYAGTTTVLEGRLELNKSMLHDAAVPGDLIIGDDTDGADAHIVQCLGSYQLSEQSSVTVKRSGRFRVVFEEIGSLAGDGNVTIDFMLRPGYNNASTVFNGFIGGASGNLQKQGSGTLTLNGNANHGSSGVEGGILVINGIHTPLIITSPGTELRGNGTVGLVVCQGRLSPGNSPGALASGDLGLMGGASYYVELNGPTPGTGYDQVKTSGTVDLIDGNLEVALNFVPTLGQALVIIDNDGTDPVLGHFNGLQEGDILRVNQIPFLISYQGGDGNDVTLTATNRSLSLVGTRVEAGNGNGVIDADECDHLFVALLNETGGPLAVTRAVLDSLTPGVMVTQQRSEYAVFGALDIRTNRTPFQIRTAPDFACGQLIELALTVSVSGGGGGTFTIPFTVPSGGAGTPMQFDNGANLNVPDLTSATSTITVANAEPYVGKVTVSLHLTHPSPGDLVLRLRSPSGTVVTLADRHGGATDNYGAGCGQANATTFDDNAPTKIAAGAAPFVGSFTPDEPLDVFLGENPNGDWRLLISDTVAGDSGVLRCWSLSISPPSCTGGGGVCESCTPGFTGRFTADMASTTTRMVRNGVPSGCGSAKACPAVIAGLRLFYRVHFITNNGPETCVSVVLSDLCRASNLRLHAAAYLDRYDPADPCANYLGDTGSELTSGSTGFSFTAPQNAVIALVVSSPVSATACPTASYLLQTYGLPCPPTTLHIDKSGNPDEVRLSWSTAYPDFDLQQALNLGGLVPDLFENVTITPVVVNGDYSVTNRISDSQAFYRLRKP